MKIGSIFKTNEKRDVVDKNHHFLKENMKRRSAKTKACFFAWLGLAWLGLAWLGLAWSGLAWLGLAWLGLVFSFCFGASLLHIFFLKSDVFHLRNRDLHFFLKIEIISKTNEKRYVVYENRHFLKENMKKRSAKKKACFFAWLGLAWLGLAWLGLAWLGLAWLGLAWLLSVLFWLGLAWLGLVFGFCFGASLLHIFF